MFHPVYLYIALSVFIMVASLIGAFFHATTNTRRYVYLAIFVVSLGLLVAILFIAPRSNESSDLHRQEEEELLLPPGFDLG
jgi:archaellum biogenesis protein FlaJ (TadC family)